MKFPLVKCGFALTLVTSRLLLTTEAAAQSTDPSAAIPSPALEGKRTRTTVTLTDQGREAFDAYVQAIAKLIPPA